MRKTWAVARKELRQIARDPLSLIMLVGLPAFMLVLYGFALNFDVRHVALAVQDLDGSRASRDLLSAFVNSTYFDVTAVAEAGDDLERITRSRAAKVVLVIPRGFGDDLASGRRAAVQLLLDGTDATTAQTILGYAGAITSESNLRLLHGALARAGQPAPARTDYEPRVFYNPELRSTQFLVPGLIGFLLMLTAVLSTAMSVVREKERGTFEQLRLTPLSTFELLVGKTVPYLVVSLLAMTLVLFAARLLFGLVVQGSLVQLYAVSLLFLAGALGFGLLISSLVARQQDAFQIAGLASMLPTVLLSGFIFPIRSMPLPLQLLSHVVPARYFVKILRGVILKGAPATAYPWDLLALVVFAGAMLTLSSLRLARGTR